jgi:hypothetical protein
MCQQAVGHFWAKRLNEPVCVSLQRANQTSANQKELQEFDLPSGEKHRLRFIQPFSPEVTHCLLTHSKSPFDSEIIPKERYPERLLNARFIILSIWNKQFAEIKYRDYKGGDAEKFKNCYIVTKKTFGN